MVGYLVKVNMFLQILKDKAKSRLKRAADKHWSDGALEVHVFVFPLLHIFIYGKTSVVSGATIQPKTLMEKISPNQDLS